MQGHTICKGILHARAYNMPWEKESTEGKMCPGMEEGMSENT
jgi:hypothetical protein